MGEQAVSQPFRLPDLVQVEPPINGDRPEVRAGQAWLNVVHLGAARSLPSRPRSPFDSSTVPGLPKARVEELATGRFISAHECVILVGNPGTRKAHILLGLGMETIRHSFRVRFVTAPW